MMFLGLRKLENIRCGHKMFLNKIRNIFCVPDTKFVSVTNVARVGKRGNICVGNNVSLFARVLNTERTYKWKLSGSARQSEIGILCFDCLFTQMCRTPAKFEFSPNGKGVLRHSMASSLESSISFSTLLFRRNLTLPFFRFCCFQFLCTEYGTV